MSTLVIKSGGEKGFAEWQRHFAELAPGLTTQFWDDPKIDRAQADYALVWEPEPGALAAMPGLRCIFSTGAGVDHVVHDPAFPKHIPLYRMTPGGAAQRMGEFVCWAVLHLMRDGPRITAQQRDHVWQEFTHPAANELRVGVMGLGALGARAAEMLAGLGFQVAGWSRSAKEIPGVKSYAGEAELPAFLARTDVLVCLLPSTPATRHILSAPLFAQLPRGAMLVNVARGAHQKIGDVLAALDDGTLSAALIDVYETEPLPADSPAWSHPRLVVTPHIASIPSRRERAVHVLGLIREIEAGREPPNRYNPEIGY